MSAKDDAANLDEMINGACPALGQAGLGSAIKEMAQGGSVLPGTLFAVTFIHKPVGTNQYTLTNDIFDGVNNPARAELVDAAVRCEYTIFSSVLSVGAFQPNFDGISAVYTGGSNAWQPSNPMGSSNAVRLIGMVAGPSGMPAATKKVLEKNKALTLTMNGAVNFSSGYWIQVELLLRAIA